MPISSTLNYEINLSAPIDTRLVATSSADRDNILYKYAGLKVYVLNDGKTYVYGTNSEWTLDGGSTINQQQGGIYGGSGVLPSDVNVLLGTISSSQYDETNTLTLETNDSSGDKAYLYNYGYRKDNGVTVDTIAFRTEHRLLPNGGSLQQSGFIEYNGLNPVRPTQKSTLNIGVGDTTFSSKVIKVSLTPTTTEFFTGQDPITNQEPPLTITRLDGLHTTIGYNTINDPTNSDTYKIADPGYRMRFGNGNELTVSEWDFDIKVMGSSIWRNMIKIDTNIDPDLKTSTIKFRLDGSANDWDFNSSRSQDLRTIPEFVRSIEHRYTKLQTWGQGTSFGLRDDILSLNDDGNSYEYVFQSALFIKDIQIRRGSTRSAFQDGAIITIKFTNRDGLSKGYLRIRNQQGNNDSNIKSKITDETFGSVSGSTPPNDQKLTITHDGTSINGDIITFRKFGGFWEIINVDRQNKILERIWETTGAKNITTTPWAFSTIGYLSGFSTPYSFKNYNANISVTYRTSADTTSALNKPPGTLIFAAAPQSSHRQTVNPTGFNFRISVDGNRLVIAQGNFRINFGSNFVTPNTNFWSDGSRPNVWKIGKINKLNLLPQWENTWTFCTGYLRDTSTNTIFSLSEMILYITIFGEIMISFKSTAPSGWDARSFPPDFDVYVPPFTYTAATSLTTSSSGGTSPPAPPPGP